MSANRKDISQISQYLKGQLDNAERHELERAAQDDPFLAEALDGYEFGAKAPDEAIDTLHKRLEARVTDRRSTRLLWRVIPIAACLLLILGSGYWFLTRQQLSQQTARVAKPVISSQIKPADSLIAVKPIPTSSKKHKHNIAATDLLRRDIVAATLSKSHPETLPPAQIAGALRQEHRPIAPVEVLVEGKVASSSIGAGSKDLLMAKQLPAPKYVMPGNEVQDNPVATVPELLQGRVANLNIQNNTGAPGLRGSVNIRGLAPAPNTEIKNRPVPIGYHLISGQIIDSVSGVPMQAVTIGMFGRGVIQTDRYGKFAIAVPAKGEFYVSSAGYKAQMIEIDKKTNFSVYLNQAQVLKEISIKGYADRKKSEINSEPISEKAVITPRLPGDTVCHENIKFRDRFLGSVGIVIKRDFEKHNDIPITVSDKQYNKALKFLAKYVDLNQTPYQWHNWYDANKCNFIK